MPASLQSATLRSLNVFQTVADELARKRASVETTTGRVAALLVMIGSSLYTPRSYIARNDME